MPSMATDPFALDELPVLARPSVRWLSGIDGCRRLYRTVLAGDQSRPFDQRVLDALGVTVQVDVAGELLPATGPLVIVSNHPRGIVDGLALMSACRHARPDVRVVANHLLARIPELREFCFFVDPFAHPAASARSLAGLRAAHRWLRGGGALIMFPAGEVAHGPALGGMRLEAPWKATAERLADAAGAPMIRAQIDGQNSRLFYALGRIHPALRTALLPREFLKKRGGTVTIAFRHADDTAARHARAPLRIASEIVRLPPESLLVESGGFQVFCARAPQIPETLREIGRLRELTYRAIGEGTGRTRDLDRFDQRYRHLFLWDRKKQQIAGAYRIAPTDEIIAADDVAGLYTRTLFRYDARFFDRIGAPALELGRSFVAADYQKNYSALLLLWKGIAEFVMRHPRYRYLFGPVSISARYSDRSHRLMMEFLRQNHLAPDLASLVDAVNPKLHTVAPDASPLGSQTIDEVDRLVAHAEGDGRGVPVLLRQYLKLNAQLLGFNVDQAFGDALDALMIVDLTKVAPAILARYFGRSGAAAFLRFHTTNHDTLAA